MSTFKCMFCLYSTLKKTDYNKHITTNKHLKNVDEYNRKNNNNENSIQINQTSIQLNQDLNQNKLDIIDSNQKLYMQQDNEFKQQILEQNEELRKKIEQLERVNNQNTNKIVKEARALKKSILTILNTNFKDTPSIDYIKEDEFKNELESEYKCKLDDPNNKLFMRIFNDYENKRLIETLSNLILKVIKKEDQKLQSVFNIDSSRGNYATKIEDYWLNDKSGLQLKKYTLEMVIKYMLNILDKFRLTLVGIRKENIKKPCIEKSDFLMKYSTLLLELNSFLLNTNTHKKVILFMCPELRLDQKLLETITDS
jgi:hypothetical protein